MFQYKILIFTLTVFFIFFSIFTFQEAFATPSIEWRLLDSKIVSAPLNQGKVFGNNPFVTLHVEDIELSGNSILDSITVELNSTSGDSLTLVLTEKNDDGIFDSERIVMVQGDAKLTINSVVLVTVEDPNCGGKCDPLVPEVLTGLKSISIFSDDDPFPGITLTLKETGIDTKIFTGTFDFTRKSSNGNSLLASEGNVITLVDNSNAETQNSFINPGKGNEGVISVIPEGIGEIPGSTYFVTALYKDAKAKLEVTDDGSGGRCTGGCVRPGLVADNPTEKESNNGGSCSGNCSPPTLGLDKNLNRIVFEGFSYNDNSVNVENFYTPFPLITANIGQQNIAVLKIYDDEGVENISHVGLAFGLGKDQSFSESEASINLDITFDGKEIVTKYDPQNVLDDIKIITSKESCGGPPQNQCLIVTIHHMFREELKFNMVGTVIWDSHRNSWQNNFNHGIHIVGDSLNPPKTKMVAFGEKNMRGLFELTRIDKINDVWIDEFGNTYVDKGNDRFDKINTIVHGKEYDKITSHGCDRNCNWFDQIKLEQELTSELILEEILHGKNIVGEPPKKPFTYDIKILDRSEDAELQKRIILEKIKAEKYLENLLD